VQGAAFVDWQPFQHPQLGPVEIGGWRVKLYQQNAPLQYLLELCEQHSRFTLAHASLCPFLSLRTVQVEARNAEVFHLLVVVQNNGFLPTYTSKKALERQCVRPIEVALTLPEGVRLVSGHLWQEVGHLEGRTNKLGVRSAGSAPTDNQCKIEWVLQGRLGAAVEVQVRSQRAGTVRRSMVLGEGCNSGEAPLTPPVPKPHG
jgi:murein tripeptide amidase MpaA